MRWAHVDEAGISKNDKVASVVGILSEPDRHYHTLAAKLREIQESVPEPLRRGGLIFHAKDIWHGNKRFDKDLWLKHGWDKDRRRSLVLEICKIPAQFDLPVVMGVVFKEQHDWSWLPLIGIKSLTAEPANYAVAFLMCCIMVEALMCERIQGSEVAHIVAEDTNEMREHARWAYDLARAPSAPWAGNYRAFLPMQRVVEDPMFSAKTRSSLLQIADSLAFVTSRHFAEYEDVLECFSAFYPQIVYPNSSYEPPA